ncbi:hypothetical protein [Bordetella flabilis]|uniref:Inclusion body protein n=1 Tax=Bordetella flabilis TaxID=463014 RepID=A0A193GF04_9BORD|nr:hypothetical protein [Bordetella flabilis]ANN78031.1 hypothetical protein BAU07_13865 [Bordetella flabilis]
MANPPTTDCDIQIRILIDDNTVQNGTSNGVYIMDNRVGAGSGAEGASNLNTVANINEKICWRVEPLNPSSQSTFTIQSIGEISAWGYTGGPGISPDLGESAYTGTVEAACAATAYNIDIYASLANGGVMTLSVQPSITAN